MSQAKEKRLARERMRQTGENYTTALAHVRREYAEQKAPGTAPVLPSRVGQEVAPEVGFAHSGCGERCTSDCDGTKPPLVVCGPHSEAGDAVPHTIHDGKCNGYGCPGCTVP